MGIEIRRCLIMMLLTVLTACGGGMPECWQPFTKNPVYRVYASDAQTNRLLCINADTVSQFHETSRCEIDIVYDPDDIGLADITVHRKGFVSETRQKVPNNIPANGGEACFSDGSLTTEVNFRLEWR